ncbi:MAG: PucR family transcriptional regulator [Ruminococcaceae bacterium]|nr:PucR family transcriptional regulator [Oscillospiraceae bacterium]
MSNRLFQNIIQQMKDVVGRNIGVIDENGIIVASSELGKIGESKQRIKEELSYSSSSMIYDGYTYRFVNCAGKSDCIAFVEGDDIHSGRMAEMLAIALGNIKSLYDEKYDKVSFIKNIILDNILPSDIYIRSNELHFSEEFRAVIVVRFQGSSPVPPYEIIQNLVPDRNKDYVIGVSEQDIVIVKEVTAHTTADDLEEYAIQLIETINKSHTAKLLAGISSIVGNLKDLSRAYKEARISLEVGKVFDIEKTIMCYENLGIGRLIYQLPTTLCEIFLDEVFKKGSLESLDRETLMTVQSFFENNLNVSETSRKLFVHRNTLVYRLEKIRKLTGLDLREFDHAVTFKVALMVKKYLTSKPTKF